MSRGFAVRESKGKAKEREGSVGEGCDRCGEQRRREVYTVGEGSKLQRFGQGRKRGVFGWAVGLGRSATTFGGGKQAGRVRKMWAARCSSHCELQVGPAGIRRVGQARQVKRARRAKSSPGGPPIRRPTAGTAAGGATVAGRRHQDGTRPTTGSHNAQTVRLSYTNSYKKFGSTSPVNRRG
ncbi:hypothetical protein ACLOJK_023967 [Asimina triloba]